ncbi:unnamed protein product [Caenorhabditis auriculariae]|uniref:Uncharacterized protein n=1 Tax=Caenorhabditis auriculariae TaxID=2777116 RepID=A0A8S1HW95_9PELO|nr:unnamed protein product [Caenorhabditis auriculariae]
MATRTKNSGHYRVPINKRNDLDVISRGGAASQFCRRGPACLVAKTDLEIEFCRRSPSRSPFCQPTE